MSKEERILKRKRRIEEMENYGLDVGFYQKELRERHGPDARRPDDGVRHSGSYHRFFEGYSEQRVLGEDGKRAQILRVYVGEYYRRVCSDATWIGIKIAYMALFVLGFATYIYALVLPIGSNQVWYVAVPGLCSVVPLLLLFSKLAACVVAKRTMVIYERKHVFGRVFRRSMIVVGFLGATLLMKLLYVILSWSAVGAGEMNSCLGCLIAVGAILGIALLERHACYETLGNKQSPLEDGVVL